MNIEKMAEQMLESMISDLMYAYDLDRDLAEKVVGTIIRYPSIIVEVETAVRNKRSLGI